MNYNCKEEIKTNSLAVGVKMSYAQPSTELKKLNYQKHIIGDY